MNKADSEHMLGLLDEIDYKPTDILDDADLVIFNTCTIREAANDRLYGHIGILKNKKRDNPNLLVGVGGCVSQDKKDWLQKKYPHVDIVFGTNNIHNLPKLVKKAETGEKVCEIEDELPLELPEMPVIRQTSVTAWVNVILGCNFNCTYCIVPSVRGRERSRKPEQILDEVKRLAEEGFKEITLLGQNVTAYGFDLSSNYSKEKASFGHIPEDPEYSLAKLLKIVHEVDGIERIRFLTGHPYHVTDELIETVTELPKVCEFFHVPMQSGDDEVLRRMARVYTRDMYKEMADKIRAKMPRASITSDFIVGFPGETEAQFMNTVKAIQEIGFDASISAAYSPRPDTPGATWDNQVEEDVKNSRLRFLNQIINEVAKEKSMWCMNESVEVLVEGRSDKNEKRLTGRTRGNKIVNFEGLDSLIGSLVDVKITQVNSWSLLGELVNQDSGISCQDSGTSCQDSAISI